MINTEIKNFGLKGLGENKITDWYVGGLTPLPTTIINSSGKFTTPEPEYQNRWNYDRLACVSYSLLNCLESLYFYKTGHFINFSDRWLAARSGTTRAGNSMAVVFDTARNHGLVTEDEYPDTEGGWNEYYQAIPQEVQDKAKLFLNDWLLYREWINTDNKEAIFNALYEAPLQVLVKFANGTGYLNPIGDYNHAVMLYGAKKGEYWMIFDSYTQSYKKYDWNYTFGAVLKPSLIQKTNNTLMLENNTLVQLVQGNGGFGLFLDGKIIVDDTDKILASYIVRNDGNIKGKTKALTLEDWDKYEKVNLKGIKL